MRMLLTLKKVITKRLNHLLKFARPLRRVLTISEYVVSLVLLLISISLILPLAPTKKYLSSSLIQSGSMEPTIKTGSIAFTKTLSADDVKEGDIITYKGPGRENQIVIHRVSAVDENAGVKTFKTKGDNNAVEDSWTVYASQIQGKYLFSVPYLGYLALLFKTYKGFLVLAGIPSLVLTALQVVKIREGIKEEVERRVNKKISKLKVTPEISNMILFIGSVGLLSFGTFRISVAKFLASSTLNNVTITVANLSLPEISPSPTPKPEIVPNPNLNPKPNPDPRPVPSTETVKTVPESDDAVPSIPTPTSNPENIEKPAPTPITSQEAAPTPVLTEAPLPEDLNELIEVTPTPQSYLGPPCVICGEEEVRVNSEIFPTG